MIKKIKSLICKTYGSSANIHDTAKSHTVRAEEEKVILEMLDTVDVSKLNKEELDEYNSISKFMRG